MYDAAVLLAPQLEITIPNDKNSEQKTSVSSKDQKPAAKQKNLGSPKSPTASPSIEQIDLGAVVRSHVHAANREWFSRLTENMNSFLAEDPAITSDKITPDIYIDDRIQETSSIPQQRLSRGEKKLAQLTSEMASKEGQKGKSTKPHAARDTSTAIIANKETSSDRNPARYIEATTEGTKFAQFAFGDASHAYIAGADGLWNVSLAPLGGATAAPAGDDKKTTTPTTPGTKVNLTHLAAEKITLNGQKNVDSPIKENITNLKLYGAPNADPSKPTDLLPFVTIKDSDETMPAESLQIFAAVDAAGTKFVTNKLTAAGGVDGTGQFYDATQNLNGADTYPLTTPINQPIVAMTASRERDRFFVAVADGATTNRKLYSRPADWEKTVRQAIIDGMGGVKAHAGGGLGGGGNEEKFIKLLTPDAPPIVNAGQDATVIPLREKFITGLTASIGNSIFQSGVNSDDPDAYKKFSNPAFRDVINLRKGGLLDLGHSTFDGKDVGGGAIADTVLETLAEIANVDGIKGQAKPNIAANPTFNSPGGGNEPKRLFAAALQVSLGWGINQLAAATKDVSTELDTPKPFASLDSRRKTDDKDAITDLNIYVADQDGLARGICVADRSGTEIVTMDAATNKYLVNPGKIVTTAMYDGIKLDDENALAKDFGKLEQVGIPCAVYSGADAYPASRAMISGDVDMLWDDQLQRLFVGFSDISLGDNAGYLTNGSGGACSIMVGKEQKAPLVHGAGGNNALYFQPIIGPHFQSLLFQNYLSPGAPNFAAELPWGGKRPTANPTDYIVGFYQKHDPAKLATAVAADDLHASAKKLRVMHTSTGKDYIVFNGGVARQADLPSLNAKLYALPLIGAYDANLTAVPEAGLLAAAERAPLANPEHFYAKGLKNIGFLDTIGTSDPFNPATGNLFALHTAVQQAYIKPILDVWKPDATAKAVTAALAVPAGPTIAIAASNRAGGGAAQSDIDADKEFTRLATLATQAAQARGIDNANIQLVINALMINSGAKNAYPGAIAAAAAAGIKGIAAAAGGASNDAGIGGAANAGHGAVGVGKGAAESKAIFGAMSKDMATISGLTSQALRACYVKDNGDIPNTIANSSANAFNLLNPGNAVADTSGYNFTNNDKIQKSWIIERVENLGLDLAVPAAAANRAKTQAPSYDVARCILDTKIASAATKPDTDQVWAEVAPAAYAQRFGNVDNIDIGAGTLTSGRHVGGIAGGVAGIEGSLGWAIKNIIGGGRLDTANLIPAIATMHADVTQQGVPYPAFDYVRVGADPQRLSYDTSANVLDSWVVGDSVYVALGNTRDADHTGEAGVFESKAIFHHDGFVRAWTPWRRVQGSIDPTAGIALDPTTSRYWGATKKDATSLEPGEEDLDTVRVTAWGKGYQADPTTDNRLSTAIDKAFGDAGGVFGMFSFGPETPGFKERKPGDPVPANRHEQFSMIVATGNGRVALAKSGAFDSTDGVFKPTTAYEDKTNIFTFDATTNPALGKLGIITCAEVSRLPLAAAPENRLGWLFVGGTGGLAVFTRWFNGKGWNTTLGEGLSDLLPGAQRDDFPGGSGWRFMQILAANGTNPFKDVRKIVSDGSRYLYVMMPDSIYRIDMKAISQQPAVVARTAREYSIFKRTPPPGAPPAKPDPTIDYTIILGVDAVAHAVATVDNANTPAGGANQIFKDTPDKQFLDMMVGYNKTDGKDTQLIIGTTAGLFYNQKAQTFLEGVPADENKWTILKSSNAASALPRNKEVQGPVMHLEFTSSQPANKMKQALASDKLEQTYADGNLVVTALDPDKKYVATYRFNLTAEDWNDPGQLKIEPFNEPYHISGQDNKKTPYFYKLGTLNDAERDRIEFDGPFDYFPRTAHIANSVDGFAEGVWMLPEPSSFLRDKATGYQEDIDLGLDLTLPLYLGNVQVEAASGAQMIAGEFGVRVND